MSPIHHAIVHARKWGGEPEDYLMVDRFLDSTKLHFGDIRHRAILHNSFGVGLCESIFGEAIRNSNGRDIPVRWIAEAHILQDCGFIPSIKDWLNNIQTQPWMRKVAVKSEEIEVV